MNRDEFMRELEYLLQDIQEEDKADALSYYRDYLEEAGDDAEQAILEFGSPERIAAIIRSDIAGHLEEGGEFTERGYEDERFKDPNYQVAKRFDLPEKSEDVKRGTGDGHTDNQYGKSKNNSSAVRVLVGIILILVCFPLILGIGGGALGILGGMFGILLAGIIVIAVLTVVFFIAGIIAGVAGIAALALEPFSGLLGIGIALLMLGIGFLCLVAAVQFYGRFLPWLFTGIIDFFGNLFHRKERQV